jgi:hypothetical protein
MPEFVSYSGTNVAVSRTVEEQAFMPAFSEQWKKGALAPVFADI